MRYKQLPELKNNEERKQFLETYPTWPVWFRVPEASEVYYRYDLPDGTSIVICQYDEWLSWKEQHWKFAKADGDDSPHIIRTREYLLFPGYHYLADCASSRSALVEHLRKLKTQKGE